MPLGLRRKLTMRRKLRGPSRWRRRCLLLLLLLLLLLDPVLLEAGHPRRVGDRVPS